ncbi:glutamate ABC transporter substrate-binding protein [Agreia sp. VKM Ac-1783]|uniref:glutamate ABC transporter substrate-binding protein n=1 Tax=Agreia sp. VKM Ac-1783 TaxID=1938889 RepID=UPI000A2AE76F|nr:glutamate ABC transporter substrate-binding protein [Agreia sp. VKM Ac-1783]SMQ60636.1 amino acid ABC transporter substrate-binding protein, PAAT family [Agreia sp. VKM Ac-1783]
MTPLKKISVACAAIAVVAMLAGCSVTPTGPDLQNAPAPTFPEKSTMAKLEERGSITIGTSFDKPLFGFDDGSGTPEGFDVEIGKIIASSLGIPEDKIVWKAVEPENRESAIKLQKVDLVVSTYSITDARKLEVGFSGPYYTAAQSIMIRNDETAIKSRYDLSGRPVCSVTATTSTDRIASYGAKLVAKDTMAECVDLLRLGDVVAVAADNVIIAGVQSQNPDEFTTAGDVFGRDDYGIGLPRRDGEFRDFINVVLEESFADGSYEAAWDRSAGTVLGYNQPPAIKRY